MTERTWSAWLDDIETGDRRPSCIWLQQRREDPDSRCLACAVRAEQSKDATLFDGQIEPVERANLS